ncbi:Phosphoserine phosphatase RsbP [Streptomyces tendae]
MRYLSTLMDGTIAKINSTLLNWLGLERRSVVGRMRFTDLLTVGGKLYHETHFAPLLRMQGEIGGIALDVKGADGSRIPVLVSSAVKRGTTGEPLLIRTTVFDARDRRAYEEELLRARKAAEEARAQAEADRGPAPATPWPCSSSHCFPPACRPYPGMESAVHYRTASPRSPRRRLLRPLPGDDGESFAFFLGDVCGKGPPGRGGDLADPLHPACGRPATMPDPVAALTTLNKVLNERYNGGDPRYCTVIFGVLEPDRRPARSPSAWPPAGHPPRWMETGAIRHAVAVAPEMTVVT